MASSWKNFCGRGTLNHTPSTMRYCFVGKNFVVRFSTTKTTKILPPEKYPLYSRLYRLIMCLYSRSSYWTVKSWLHGLCPSKCTVFTVYILHTCIVYVLMLLYCNTQMIDRLTVSHLLYMSDLMWFSTQSS